MSMPAMTVPRQRARPTSGCTCDPPWPLLYTTPNGTQDGTQDDEQNAAGSGVWQQVRPAPLGRHGPAWCIGCGAPYTGPWLPHPGRPVDATT